MIASSAEIHPSAIIEDGAQIGDNVIIGPFCTIGSSVSLAAHVELKSHVSIMGNTSIGENCVIYPQAVLGGAPQNIHYKGENTALVIGKNNVIREGVTMHTGMPDAGNETVVGDHNLFLAYSHVAHDCRVGNQIILSNNVMLGGHVEVGDRVIMGGGAAAHQFVRIGHHAFLGAMSLSNHDVVPFGMVTGVPGHLNGLNVIGMGRAGFSKSEILDIRRFYKHIFEGPGHFKDRIEQAHEMDLNEAERDMFEFASFDSRRGLLFPCTDKKRG